MNNYSKIKANSPVIPPAERLLLVLSTLFLSSVVKCTLFRQ